MLVLILMTADGTDRSELPTLLVFPQHSSGSQCCNPGTVSLRQSRVERWHLKHPDISYCTFKSKDRPKQELEIASLFCIQLESSLERPPWQQLKQTHYNNTHWAKMPLVTICHIITCIYTSWILKLTSEQVLINFNHTFITKSLI